MRRKIDDLLKDLIIKAIPLSPYPDDQKKNFVIDGEFFYEIQNYLDSIPKKEEDAMNKELKFCVDCKFHHPYTPELRGAPIGEIKYACQHEYATETDLVIGTKKFLSCEKMRSGEAIEGPGSLPGWWRLTTSCGKDGIYFEKKEG